MSASGVQIDTIIAIAIGLGIVIVVLVSFCWFIRTIQRERPTPVTTLNAQGTTGAALVVFHPGRTDFSRRIAQAYADGLVQANWRVDLTTASQEAPTDIVSYDLIVLGSPIYGPKLTKPLSNYLAALGDLAGKPVVTLLTGAGLPTIVLPVYEAVIRAANGVAVYGHVFTAVRPNAGGSVKSPPGSNIEQALAIARDAGKVITSVLP